MEILWAFGFRRSALECLSGPRFREHLLHIPEQTLKQYKYNSANVLQRYVAINTVSDCADHESVSTVGFLPYMLCINVVTVYAVDTPIMGKRQCLPIFPLWQAI